MCTTRPRPSGRGAKLNGQVSGRRPKGDLFETVLSAIFGMCECVINPLNVLCRKSESMSTRPKEPDTRNPAPTKGRLSQVLLAGLNVEHKPSRTVPVKQTSAGTFVPAVVNEDFFVARGSTSKLRKFMKQMLVDNIVVTGAGDNTLLAPVPVGTSLGWSKLEGLVFANGEFVYEGGFNVAYKFDMEQVVSHRLYTAGALPNLSGVLPNDKQLILRTSIRDRSDKPLPSALSAMQELFINAFASENKIGPKLFAAWMTVDNEIRALLPVLDFEDGEADDLKVTLTIISEMWAGSLREPLMQQKLDPGRFATQFSDLMTRSINVGFWQVDSKPLNVLYRHSYTENGLTLELCWTDFDNRFCSINPRGVNVEISKCSVLVHAASFMGSVSCSMGNEVFRRYQPALKMRLISDFEIDKVTDYGLCDWLNTYVAAGDAPLEKAKHKVTRLLLRSMRHYIVSPETIGDKRCILEINDASPTFMTMLNFALLKAGDEEVENLAVDLEKRLR